MMKNKKRALFVAVGISFALTVFDGTSLFAVEPSRTQTEIQEIETRVNKLEAELKAVRQALARLRATLPEQTSIQVNGRAKPAPLQIHVLEGGWGRGGIADIRAVCLSAAGELWRYFPDRKPDTISVRHSENGPMVVYGKGPNGDRRVLLNTKDTYWSQFAFQFAHEFCHILCNYREVNNPNLWFEESLCETASLFAMRRMSETWKTNPPYPNWASYAPSLKSYVDDRLDNTDRLEGVTLAQWYRRNETTLRDNAGDRAKNRVVAAILLPLLEKNPQHWEAVSYLNAWDNGQQLSFRAYLLDWQGRVPERHKPFVANLAQLFEISLD